MLMYRRSNFKRLDSIVFVRSIISVLEIKKGAFNAPFHKVLSIRIYNQFLDHMPKHHYLRNLQHTD